MVHRDDAAAARHTIEPTDLMVEADDELEQNQHARCPEPAKAHRDCARCEEKGQPDGAEDSSPSKGGEIEGERPRPAHRGISARAALSGVPIVAGLRRSISGRPSAPRYLK